MDRKDGRVKWKREARVGFRHHAIISSEDVVYVVDGLSENAVEFKARRGQAPDEPSRGIALDLENGEEIWSSDSNVFGTFLLYSREHNILLLCIFLSSTSWIPRVVIGAKYRAADAVLYMVTSGKVMFHTVFPGQDRQTTADQPWAVNKYPLRGKRRLALTLVMGHLSELRRQAPHSQSTVSEKA